MDTLPHLKRVDQVHRLLTVLRLQVLDHPNVVRLLDTFPKVRLYFTGAAPLYGSRQACPPLTSNPKLYCYQRKYGTAPFASPSHGSGDTTGVQPASHNQPTHQPITHQRNNPQTHQPISQFTHQATNPLPCCDSLHTSPQGHSIMLAQEYCCGDLSHIIGGATQRFPEAVVKGIMQQVLRGLAAIHQAGVEEALGWGGEAAGVKGIYAAAGARGCALVGERVATWQKQVWPFAQRPSHAVV